MRILFKTFTLIVFLCISLLPVFSDDQPRTGFQGVSSLAITEKADIRIRENGRYLGYLYKEVRSYFDLIETETLTSGADEYTYAGTVYVLEDLKQKSGQAKWIDEIYDIELSATSTGRYSTVSGMPFPRTRGFPVFPVNSLEDGATWREYGEQVLVPRDDGQPTKIEFYCEFRYKGTGMYLNREVHIITAQYATRYRKGQDPGGDETLSEATGKHLLTIYLDAARTGWMFIRDQVDEQFNFTDGVTREHEGFYLTWYEGSEIEGRDSDTKLVEESLQQSSVADVSVEETD
ncbi:MAG: hypothetical protein HN368_09270, partial [Spirochaetales bacterium]|nr:hypothetical protein [Spirochaetales bacterium]